MPRTIRTSARPTSHAEPHGCPRPLQLSVVARRPVGSLDHYVHKSISPQPPKRLPNEYLRMYKSGAFSQNTAATSSGSSKVEPPSETPFECPERARKALRFSGCAVSAFRLRARQHSGHNLVHQHPERHVL